MRCAALDVPAMDVGGLDLLDRYEERIALEDPFLQTADDMSFFCHGDGAFLKLDQDGRITVSDFIREHTGISAEVAFVGRGNFFQIWEPGRLRRLWRGGARPAFAASAGDEAWGATGMMAGHGEDIHAVGGPARHIPVLLAEVLRRRSRRRRARSIVDGTFGAGGYTRAHSGGRCVGRRDRSRSRRHRCRRGPRSGIPAGRLQAGAGAVLDARRTCRESVDGVVLDIGVSSMQLDQAERGFSFRADGPLDMRMAQAGLSAADVVNRFKPGDLARIFGFLGEERHAGRIARMIERRREKRPFERTLDLADAIETHVGRNPKDKIHPATRVFQALRIFVNDELGELARALFAAERALKPGGRLAVVTFHSLEDRIVKRFIADRSGQRRGSRHLPEAKAPPRPSTRPAVAIDAGRRRDRRQSARTLGQAAGRRSARRRRPAPADFSIVRIFQNCPTSSRPGER